MKFSLVYPTRHRPAFIKMALKFLEHQDYKDFEIVICDNYIDQHLSCELHCNQSGLKNIKYVKPPMPLNMVENWNYALQFTSGEYICYFTDKMFLLPGTLNFVAEILEGKPSDILNWVDNKFAADNFPDYFGPGHYKIEVSDVEDGALFQMYDPMSELRKKAEAAVSRSEQSPSHYARGKICFGAYSKKLVDKILIKAKKLFHNIAPDYTSMILGLSCAKTAIEVSRPGIVHIGTDLSNGGQGAINDEIAYRFITSLNNYKKILEEMFIPHLYICQHNVVSHDYITLKNKYSLDFHLNRLNWLIYIFEDFNIHGRTWSSSKVATGQKKIFDEFIEYNLSEAERVQYHNQLRVRSMNNRKNQYLCAVKNMIRPIIPYSIINYYRKFYYRASHIHLDALTDLLLKSGAEK